MATFGFRKREDEIEEPVLLPEDWYVAEIVEDPKLVKNNTLAEMVGESEDEDDIEQALRENEKAGHNLVVKVKIIDEDPVFNDRRFKIYLPYPNEFDLDRYDGIGQKVYDAKMKRIIDFTKAFGGDVDGEMITLLPKLKGQVYVIQQKRQNGDEMMINSIDLFAGFKPVEE